VLVLLPLTTLVAAPGDVDTSFQSSRGASDTIQCIVEEPDGKLLIGGDFSAADDVPRGRIARMNADGTLDRWFLSGLSGADHQVRVMLREPDGRILVGGAFRNINGVPRAHIARLLPDGTLDDSFLRGWSGVEGSLFGIYTIVRQPNGKILIGGGFGSVNGTPRGGIARLHPDGSLDSSFMHGLAGADSTVRCVVLLPNGALVLAGSFDTVNGLPRRGVARLHSDGTVDESFQSGLNDGSFQVRSLCLQPDGKVLLGGFGIRIGGVAKGAVTRLNSDGTEDTGFNSTAIGGEARTILLQGDGKIVSAGMRGSPAQGFVERSNSDGSRDLDFKHSWYLPEAGTSSSSVQCIYLRGDGSFTAGGNFTRHDSSGVPTYLCNRLVRLKDNGQADPAFITALSGISGSVQCLQEQAGTGSKILVGGGFSGVYPQTTGPLARLNADGTPDTGFANPLRGDVVNNRCLALASGEGACFVAGGRFSSVLGNARHNVARFSATGQLDGAFQPGSLEATTQVYALARQPDGKVLLATADPSSSLAYPFLLARLNADGSRDSTFTNGLAGIARNIYSLAVLPDGKLLAAGEAVSPGNIFTLKRLHSDGTLDAAFPAPAITGSRVRALAVLPDGRVIFGGAFTWSAGGSRSNLGRLNADGTLDTTYLAAQAGPNRQVYAIALQSDDKAVIGGEFTDFSGTPRNCVARLNADGTLDTGFLHAQSGFEQNPLTTGALSTVQTLVVQTDGRIVAGGFAFNKVNGTVRNNIVRLHGDAPDITVEQPAGMPRAHDASSAVDFGPVPEGESSTLPFTIRNTGNQLLSPPVVTFSPASPPHRFSLTAPPPGGLPPGTSTTFNVTFNADGSGTPTALLEITTNDTDESPYLLRVTGAKATSLDLWRRQNFGTFTNTGSAGDSADPDHDGVVNLLEFATGTIPGEKSPPAWSLRAEGDHFVFTYARPSSALDALRYSVEWSATLNGEWQTVGLETITDEEAGIQTVTATLPADSAPRKFLRLRVRKLF